MWKLGFCCQNIPETKSPEFLWPQNPPSIFSAARTRIPNLVQPFTSTWKARTKDGHWPNNLYQNMLLNWQKHVIQPRKNAVMNETREFDQHQKRGVSMCQLSKRSISVEKLRLQSRSDGWLVVTGSSYLPQLTNSPFLKVRALCYRIGWWGFQIRCQNPAFQTRSNRVSVA